MRVILPGVIIFLFFLPKPAHAYLDPGSGSYILQMVIGLFITSAFIFRTSLNNLLKFIKKLISKSDKSIKKNKSG